MKLRTIIYVLCLSMVAMVGGCDDNKSNLKIQMPPQSHEEFLIEAIALCKNNIESTHLIPSIAMQKGWHEFNKNTFGMGKAFEQKFKDDRFEITVYENSCSVATGFNLNMGVSTQKKIMETFHPEDTGATIHWSRYKTMKEIQYILNQSKATTLRLQSITMHGHGDMEPGIGLTIMINKFKNLDDAKRNLNL